jgi:hypothetical protein
MPSTPETNDFFSQVPPKPFFELLGSFKEKFRCCITTKLGGAEFRLPDDREPDQ